MLSFLTSDNLVSVRIEVWDPDDPQIRVFQDLRDHVLRQKRELPGGDMAGVFICEGDVVVERALNAGYELLSVMVDANRKKPLPDCIDDKVLIYAAGPQVLTKMTGYNVNRGCIACFKRRDLLSVDELLGAAYGQGNLLVIEGINNPTNMGVILRCAAGLGIVGYLISPSCSDPLYRRSARVSMGEAFALPYARSKSWPNDLEKVRAAGFTIWGLTPAEDALPISQVAQQRNPSSKTAILIGTEATGLTNEALSQADKLVKIPMSGNVDSLNVGVAAAIGFYAIQFECPE